MSSYHTYARWLHMIILTIHSIHELHPEVWGMLLHNTDQEWIIYILVGQKEYRAIVVHVF